MSDTHVEEHRADTLPLVSFLCGCAGMFALVTVPFLSLLLGIAAIITGFLARVRYGSVNRAMTNVGLGFGIAAIALFWMTTGFVRIIWGL